MRLYMIIPVIAILLLAACSSEKAFSPEDYRMPENYEMQSFEVEAEGAYDMQQAVIEDDGLSWKYEQFDQWKAISAEKEALDRYQTLSKAWKRMDEDKEGYKAEEARLQEYCDENGFWKCKNIDRACDDEGCYKVTITCDDDDYDPELDDDYECSTAEVEVSEDYDEDLSWLEGFDIIS